MAKKKTPEVTYEIYFKNPNGDWLVTMPADDPDDACYKFHVSQGDGPFKIVTVKRKSEQKA